MVVFRKSILAGIIVSIAAYNYLLNYDTLSKIVFSAALLVILAMNLNLYTSKIAKWCCCNEELTCKVKNIAIILLGNFIACVIFGYLFSFLGETHAGSIWESKMQTPLLIALFKSIVVGILMQIAVFSKHDLVTIGIVLLFLGTKTEHSIANIVYMSVARAFSLKSLFYIVICLIGNAIGGSLVYLLNKDDKSASY
ncbi:Hypothetical protein SFBmNL_00648 [Candidatus Arthromitus sp. SFB-mouse-NL]|uniref:formate/nitrite transporter family protein n=1 Tax=Candidatus Arthromitus sp. SFB-mouse-NL TaxID=1508644 RepID=UPI00049B08AC|nr:formate/nitrite transporter family protein [Candidatus Arthromitus sp. SFB-mouse-NL]AID44556.1 Hypothetical protein SFBmNL_00648 [Candidatus Arthromitus sp. SFB-mouse-NL]